MNQKQLAYAMKCVNKMKINNIFGTSNNEDEIYTSLFFHEDFKKLKLWQIVQIFYAIQKEQYRGVE